MSLRPGRGLHIAVNLTKSQHVTFLFNRLKTYRLTLDLTPIKHSDTFKYLGLDLDRRLTWKLHIVATFASTR